MITSAFIVALTLGCLTSAAVYILICLFSATYNLSFKEIITLRFFKPWFNEIVECFTLKGGVLVCAAFSLLFFLPCYDAVTKIEKENLGECACRCKACKDTQKKLQALIERIGVNNEKEEFQSFKKKEDLQ